MTLKRQFINQYYNGDMGKYRHARKNDYCKVQLEWAYYIDALNKDGEITDKQAENATF